MKTLWGGAALALSIGIAGSVAAQPTRESQWTLRVGAGALVGPAFVGSKTYQVSAVPALRLAYGERFFVSVEEGLGYALVSTPALSAGPVVRAAFGRDEGGASPFRVAGRRETALRGLGEVPTTAEAGAFVRYRWESWSAGAEVRHGIGGHEGLLGDVSASHVWRFSSPFTGGRGPGIVSLGPRATFASQTYTSAYFGIDASQSLRSGLRPYSPGGGLVSFGAGGVVVVPVAPQTSVTLLFGFDRLAAAAARSPLVSERGSRNQGVFGLFATYEFAL